MFLIGLERLGLAGHFNLENKTSTQAGSKHRSNLYPPNMYRFSLAGFAALVAEPQLQIARNLSIQAQVPEPVGTGL